MIVLNNTYFQGELSLPNLKLNNDSVGHSARAMQTVGEQNLEWFVDKYERIFLNHVFGKALAKNFIDGLKQEPVNTIWNQLKEALYGDITNAPAANYVYYWIKRDARTQSTVSGEKIGTQSYTEDAEDANKLIKAWNDMVVMTENFYCYFLNKNWSLYKQYSDGCFKRHCFGTINKYGI